MKKINFTKMVASGNDFIVIKNDHKLKAAGLKPLAINLCDRKYGAGADGLLVLKGSKIAAVKMRVFNADGSEAEMCGNGARCAAFYIGSGRKTINSGFKIETKAGIIESKLNKNNVFIKLTDPKGIKLDIPITIDGRLLKVNFINTGVPHAVVFVEGLEKINIVDLGRRIRFHKIFAPKGTNADFVEVMSDDLIKIRTYERGVEDETLACGTGSVAAALIVNYKLQIAGQKRINVQTKSGEILKVYFTKTDIGFKDVWLEGKAERVYEGDYYVK